MRAGALVRLAPTLPLAAACAGLGASNWLQLPTLALVACAFAVLVAAVTSGRTRVTLVATACVAGGLWLGASRLEQFAGSELVTRVDTTGHAVVTVTGAVRSTRFSQRMPAEIRALDGLPLQERTMLELPLGRSPPQGAVIALRVGVRAPRPAEDGFDERAWLARRGVHAVLRGGEDWRIVGRRGGLAGLGDRLRSRLERTIAPGLTGERRAVVAGVVLGQDEGLSPGLRDDFRASGLYHLLAVSGQNVLFIGLGLAGLGWLLGVPRLPLELAFVAVVGAYVLVVGWQPSVVRAAVAGVLASLAWLVSRPRERWHALALGALVLLAWTPATLLEPGFQLSFAAVAAIFAVVPRLSGWLEGYPVPGELREVLAVSAACGLVTAPIVWLHFGSVPLYAVPANVLAWPAAAPLLVLGLVAAALQPVLPSAALAVAWVNGWLAAYLAWCAHTFAALPFARIGSLQALAALAAAAAAVAALALLPGRRRLVGLAAVFAVCAVGIGFVLDRRSGLPPPTGLRVVFLDVGQGDSALLQVPEGNVLVDEGPPEARVADQLRNLGVSRLAALVLSHPERDHVGGAADVLRGLSVDAILDPAQVGRAASPDERGALTAARDRQVPVIVARAGEVFRLGRLTVRVLWPEDGGPPGGNPNDHAVVLLASYGATDVLLPADAESNVTARLQIPPVEVLKVAHHGSEDDGLADQLRTLRPRIAVVSVGARNDYGHPRASTLSALRGVPGLRLYRTDLDGRVTLESDGRTITVVTER